MPNSGNTNYINLKTEQDLKEQSRSYMVNSDGEIQVMKQQFLIEITFISPIDIDKKEGSYILPTATIKDREGAQRVVNEFGGIFRVIEIKSEFRGGRYTQVLRCVRSRICRIHTGRNFKNSRQWSQQSHKASGHLSISTSILWHN